MYVCYKQKKKWRNSRLLRFRPYETGKKHIFLHTRLSLSFIGGEDREKIIMGFFFVERGSKAFSSMLLHMQKKLSPVRYVPVGMHSV